MASSNCRIDRPLPLQGREMGKGIHALKIGPSW
jgi:hypothetical protein